MSEPASAARRTTHTKSSRPRPRCDPTPFVTRACAFHADADGWERPHRALSDLEAPAQTGAPARFPFINAGFAADEMNMVRRLLKRRGGHPVRDRLILALVLAGVGGGFAYAYARRHVHRVTIPPGGSVTYRIDLPMQRALHSKSFVNEMNLPVRCRVLGRNDDDRVHVSVAATGHGIHVMWADLSIHADGNASPGVRTRLLEFTINDVGDWPRPTLLVEVRR